MPPNPLALTSSCNLHSMPSNMSTSLNTLNFGISPLRAAETLWTNTHQPMTPMAFPSLMPTLWSSNQFPWSMHCRRLSEMRTCPGTKWKLQVHSAFTNYTGLSLQWMPSPFSGITSRTMSLGHVPMANVSCLSTRHMHAMNGMQCLRGRIMDSISASLIMIFWQILPVRSLSLTSRQHCMRLVCPLPSLLTYD